MTEAAIVADGLTKRYGDNLAVDELSLSIPQGTIYGFLGPNGAVNTTTMRMLTALTIPTDGTAKVTGVPVSNRPQLTQRIGYLPANPPVFDELTELRKNENLSQGKLAKAVNVTRQTINAIERDDTTRRWTSRSNWQRTSTVRSKTSSTLKETNKLPVPSLNIVGNDRPDHHPGSRVE